MQSMPLQLTFNRNLLIDPSIINTPMMRGVAPLAVTPAPLTTAINASNVNRPVVVPVMTTVDPATSDSLTT